MDEIIKITIIHGNGYNEEIEGNIDYITCPASDEKIHIALMLNYLKLHYKNDKVIQNCNIHSSINSIAMYLSLKGDVVFLNTTSYKPNILQKHGTSGIITMPPEITKRQYYAMKDFRNKIDKFRELQIWHNLQPDGTAAIKLGNIEIVDNYLSRYEEKYAGKSK